MPDEVMFDTCGTPAYIAPEILHKKGYGKEIDIWSSGCVLYYMVTGLLPFMNNNREIALNMIKEQEPDYENYKFRIFSKESKDLIMKMLVKNPKERIQVKDALKHEFFSKNQIGINQTVN